MESFVFWGWAGAMRRRDCMGILTAVALLLATAGNLLLLSTGKLFRAATLRWFGPASDADRILKVTVSDENSHVVRVIDSQRDLAAFRQLWSALVEADAPSRSSRIQSIRRGVRTENAEVLLSQRLHRAARNMARHMGRAALPDALTRRF
jgi:cytidylate kinase